MKKLIIITMLLTATTIAFAEEPARDKQPSPEEMQQLMEMTLGPMVPMMGKMTEAMIDAQLAIGEKPETAVKLAIFKRNLYNALVKQGFSRKEAFEIMLNTAVPTAMMGMK
jgi:hypothetical protein